MTRRPEPTTTEGLLATLSDESHAAARAIAATFPPFSPAQKEVIRQTLHIVYPEEAHRDPAPK
jgi:hypothetical protein